MSFTEKKIAKCYILHDLDERNKCELSDRKLTVYKNGKSNEFAIERVISVSTQQRKLLIPIIFSGIVTPLVITGYFNGLFHPIIAIILIVGGIFSFYFGWLGEMTLTVHLTTGHRDFTIQLLTDPLKAFMEFVNQYLRNEPIYKRALYLETTMTGIDDWELIKSLTQEQDRRRLYSYWNLKEMHKSGQLSPHVSFFVLDPLKTGTEIKYRKSETKGELTPFIKGPINNKAVIEVIHHDKIQDLFE